MITCPELSIVDDGAIDYSSGGVAVGITFGTVATHSCDEGFYLFGRDTRVCSSNGTSIYGVWDTFAPECIRKYHFCTEMLIETMLLGYIQLSANVVIIFSI